MDVLLILFRWLHILAGITWIGHLYFFNFVNLQVQPKIDAATKKVVNPQLLPRALFWFRWAAMVTFLSGLVLFTFHYMWTPGVGFGPSPTFRPEGGSITGSAWWIMFGMLLALIMLINVWGVIWPAQQKIIRAVRDGQTPDPALVKRAAGASRTNTYLSGPMLFGMVGAPHFGGIGLPVAIVCIVIAEIVIWLAYRGSRTAGSTI